VYKVAPHGHIPPINSTSDSSHGEEPTQDVEFFQEDGLDGTFVIDLGVALDSLTSLGSDEITDPKDLKDLEKNPAEMEEENEASDEETESTDEENEDLDEAYD
jgi:hypothetical protein